MDYKVDMCNLTQSLVKAVDLVLSAHDYVPDKITLTLADSGERGIILNVKMQQESDFTEVTLDLTRQRLRHAYGVLEPVAI